MLTSKELLDQTGISRATLNNYIALGLIPRPEVKRISPAPGEPLTTLGYFPDWALVRIREVRDLKRQGNTMDQIAIQLAAAGIPSMTVTSQSQVDANESFTSPEKIRATASQTRSYEDDLFQDSGEKKENKYEHKIDENQLDKEVKLSKTLGNVDQRVSGQAHISLGAQKNLNLSIDQIPYAAYMLNYECGLIWLNDAAKATFFLDSAIPERAEDRSALPTLMAWAQPCDLDDKDRLLTAHFSAIKHRFTRDSLAKNLLGLPSEDRAWLEHCYTQATTPEHLFTEETRFNHPDQGGYRVLSINFREGVLFTYVPDQADANQILEWLSQRDSVIRTLLSQRLPVLTPVVAMVADLQNSVRICSELPPDEYFQLINEIWSTLDPIFREHYGAYGKHTGDGMLYYFFPQPDRNYLMNALICACKVREAMKKISNHWSLKKGWTNQLYMNIGLSEGEEWLGTFKTNTNYELVVLGETINIGARLSDFARFGKIWSTKSLVSKLSPAERDLVDYGVTRTGLEQDVFVSKSYSQVSSLLTKDDPRNAKLNDIGGQAVTEIRDIQR